MIRSMIDTGKTTISFEVFPPKNDAPYLPCKNAIDALSKFNPNFMSVTYGAGGGTSQNTSKIAAYIQNELKIPSIAHLTCASSTKDEIRALLTLLKSQGIEDILALRGDIIEPRDANHSNSFEHASDLIQEIKSFDCFEIGAACYPEGHIECNNAIRDLEYLKKKVDAGADFLITQMFFDNSVLYSFLYRALKIGIDVPVIAGVMPVTSANQIGRICSLSGTTLSQRFRIMLDKFSDNPEALKQAGIAYATEQIIDLVANGVSGIHIYTMNKPEIAGAIMSNLSSVF